MHEGTPRLRDGISKPIRFAHVKSSQMAIWTGNMKPRFYASNARMNPRSYLTNPPLNLSVHCQLVQRATDWEAQSPVPRVEGSGLGNDSDR